MALAPEVTTIRVDQLPNAPLSLTDEFPHAVGSELKKATIEELADLVATTISASGGVGGNISELSDRLLLFKQPTGNQLPLIFKYKILSSPFVNSISQIYKFNLS